MIENSAIVGEGDVVGGIVPSIIVFGCYTKTGFVCVFPGEVAVFNATDDLPK
jgi:hypothetical protein